jgi:PHP family Zn ribbon phosphoesterase
MCFEYAKVNRQDSVTTKAVGRASANIMKKYAKATEKLVENLTKKHTKQIEMLIRSNNEAISKLTESLLKAPVIKSSTDQNAKHKAWVERCKTATKCC